MEDPSITAIYRYREAFARRFKYNVRAMLDDVRRREGKSGHPVVSFAKGPARRKGRKPGRRQTA
jgi:hypothetical protein